MPEYLMINHGVGEPSRWDEYFELLCGNGHLIGGSALDETKGLSVQNHSFATARTATITGYIVFRAQDLEEARTIMLKSPVHQGGGTVELFPLVKS